MIIISTRYRTHGRLPLRLAVLATAMLAVGAVALPAAASAASDPTDAQYDSTLQVVSAGSEGPGGGSTPESAATSAPQATPAAGAPSASNAGGGSALPFTGLDVGLLAAVAGALALAGFMLRRQAKEEASDPR